MSQILIVDDEKNVLKTLAIGLERSHFSVKRARTGAEALKIMDEDTCEIVVSDICMSPMDGYTLVSRIREKYPWVRIVLISAYGFDEEKPEKKEQFQYPRLTKPFSVSDLIRILHNEQHLYKKDIVNKIILE